MDTTKKPLARKRGRPPATQVRQRARLLQAAQELLADMEGCDLALRQVALRAGVTPALAHYYFVNRDGLLAALIDAYLVSEIDAMLHAVETRAAQPVAALTSLMQRITSLAAGSRFMSRCLLLPAAHAQRARLHALFDRMLQGAQAGGLLRNDLPPDFLAQTLLGLCLFPFLESSDAGAGARASALTLQHVALLQDGIRAQRPRQDSGS